MPSSISNFREIFCNNEISTSSKRRISIDLHATPQQVHPYPKVPPRKSNTDNRGQRNSRSIIATDTPEKRYLHLQKKQKWRRSLQKRQSRRRFYREKFPKKQYFKKYCQMNQ